MFVLMGQSGLLRTHLVSVVTDDPVRPTMFQISHFIVSMCSLYICTHVLHTVRIHTHTHPFNGPFSGTTQVSRYQKGKTNLDFTEARDSEWQ